MQRGRAGRRALLAAAVVLLLAAGWFAGPGRAWLESPGARHAVERGAPELLEAAPPRTDTRPQLIGSTPRGVEQAEEGTRLVEVQVSVVAEGGTRGETVVEAGEDFGALRACGLVSFGETKVLTVRSTVRIWRVCPFGRQSRYYEETTARHAPHLGPLTLRLERGHVSLHIRAVDAEGAPVAGVAVEVSGPARVGVVLEGTTDEKGGVGWHGLTRETATDYPLTVGTQDGESLVEQASTSEVAWNEDRSRASVTLHVRRRRLLAGRLVGPGVGVFDAIELGGAVPGKRRQTWKPGVSKAGEFTVHVPHALEKIEARRTRGTTAVPDAPGQVVFVVEESLPVVAGAPIEVRTVFGGRIEGEIRDASGGHVAHALVFAQARPDDVAPSERVHPRQFDGDFDLFPFPRTDAQGGFRTEALLPGRWVVFVKPGDGSWIEIPDAIDVTGPGPTKVVLTIP